eukprot:5258902-Pyramimonas_sp.AAC.1
MEVGADRATHWWQVVSRWATHLRNVRGHLARHCKDLQAARVMCPISSAQCGRIIKAVMGVALFSRR